VGHSQSKYLESARMTPGGSDEDTRVPARPIPGHTVVLVPGVRTLVTWGGGAPLRVTAVGPVRVGRGGERPREGRARRPRGKVVPVHVRVRKACSGPGGHPAGMGVPRRVERLETPGPAPGLWFTPLPGWWSLKVTAAMLQADVGAPAGGPPG
jgi:hypothetical protein